MHMIPLLLIRKLLLHLFPALFNVPQPSPDGGYTYNRLVWGIPSALISVPIHTLITFISVYILSTILSRLPVLKKLLGF